MSISNQYSLGVPMTDFLFTNPAAAQQALGSLQARLGYQSAEDKAFQEYINRTQENAGANTRQVVGTLGQLGVAKIGEGADASKEKWMSGENALNRTSQEKIAGMGVDAQQKAALIRQHLIDTQLWQTGEEEAARGNSTPGYKGNKTYVFQDPKSGIWYNKFKRPTNPFPPAAAPPPGRSVAVPQGPPHDEAADAGAGAPPVAVPISPPVYMPHPGFNDSMYGPNPGAYGPRATGIMFGPPAPIQYGVPDYGSGYPPEYLQN